GSEPPRPGPPASAAWSLSRTAAREDRSPARVRRSRRGPSRLRHAGDAPRRPPRRRRRRSPVTLDAAGRYATVPFGQLTRFRATTRQAPSKSDPPAEGDEPNETTRPGPRIRGLAARRSRRGKGGGRHVLRLHVAGNLVLVGPRVRKRLRQHLQPLVREPLLEGRERVGAHHLHRLGRRLARLHAGFRDRKSVV